MTPDHASGQDPDGGNPPCVLRCSICGARSYLYARSGVHPFDTQEKRDERRLYQKCCASDHWLSSVNVIAPFFRYQHTTPSDTTS